MKLDVKCAFCSADLKRYSTKTNTHFCNTDCKGKWQIQQREKLGFTKEWLIEQYFEKGKSCNDIANEIGRDAKGVWGWFKQYGISIKGRGHNWQKNLLLNGSAWVGRKHTDEAKNKIREARKRDGHVPYLRDGVHWLKNTTDTHPNWKGGITLERQDVYSSLEWCEVVKEVWKRDNATCQRCGKHQSQEYKVKFNIHHIVPFANRELRIELSNLVLLCFSCHKWVHSKKNTNKEFIKTI